MRQGSGKSSKKLTTKSPHSLQLIWFVPFSLAILSGAEDTQFCTWEIHTIGTGDGKHQHAKTNTNAHFSIQETTAWLRMDTML